MQSDEDTLCTIPKETFDVYEFDPHLHGIEQHQLNAYYHMSVPAGDPYSITNNDNIPAVITDIVNDFWENYIPHSEQNKLHCHDYYCHSHGSSHQNGNSYYPTSRSLVYGTYGHGCLDYTQAGAVYQIEKEF